jgi:hypothetical protein
LQCLTTRQPSTLDRTSDDDLPLALLQVTNAVFPHKSMSGADHQSCT